MVLTALSCIALNVYFEARSDNMSGQYAVAHVVLNRVASGRWPDDVCSVVHQGYEKGKFKCQFTWYCDGKPDDPDKPGLIMEYHAHGHREDADIVVRRMVEAGMKTRGWEIGRIQSAAVDHRVQKIGAVIAAVVLWHTE